MKQAIAKFYRGVSNRIGIVLALVIALNIALGANSAFAEVCRPDNPEACMKPEIIFTPGEQYYLTPDARVDMDAKTFIENSRTYVPVRYLAHSIGIIDEDIHYLDGVVRLAPPGLAVELRAGTPAIRIADDVYDMDVAPVIRNGRTYLPARFVAEAFGYEVGWRGNQVVISPPTPETITGSMTEPDPVLVQGEDKYYSLTDALTASGIPEDDFEFDAENVIVFGNGYDIAGLVLIENSDSIFLVDKLGEYHSYALQGQLTKSNGAWLVKNKDDLVKIGMLGTLLQAGRE